MDDVPADLAAALADRYALEHVVGRGGMATVYLARDLKHRRHVAVKMLRPDLAATLGADRFLKEIEIAAALSHPHILPLHDSGQAGDTLYYVMPFIDGESLRGLLNRSGTIDRDRALEITGRVADALGYAHRQGVLHRDIKPENILMAEGHAVVADFGIAKAISTAGGIELTRTGFPLGTPGYMSPEQAAGVTDLDPRTDVYSLACVCYEMLVGEVPGLWLTDEAVKVGMFLDASATHRARLDRLPGGVEQAMVRALAIRAEHRFDTPDDFARALRKPAGPTKRFRRDEAARIVHRAAELDAAQPTADDSMTVGGVQRIAAEAGVPPARVRDAIRTPELRGEVRPPSRFLGAPAELVFECYVEGLVPEDELDGILEEVRIATGRNGYARINGRALTWTAYRPKGEGFDLGDVVSDAVEDPPKLAVRVIPRGGRTRIRVEQRLTDTAGGLFGGIMGGMGGGGFGVSLGVIGGALGAWPIAIAVAVAMVGGSYLLARSIFPSVVRSKRRKLEELFDRIVEYAREVAET